MRMRNKFLAIWEWKRMLRLWGVIRPFKLNDTWQNPENPAICSLAAVAVSARVA